MSNAFVGVGTQFLRGNGASPEVFTAIAEINSINGPSMTRDLVDVTSLDSPGGYREKITGFRDGGEVSLTMNFTLGGYGLMLTDFEDDEPVNYRMVLSDATATQIDFAAYVTDLPISVVPDDKVTLDVTIGVTGPVTLTS